MKYLMLAILLLSFNGNLIAQNCYKYDPAEIEVTGMLQKKMYRKNSYYVLKLSKEICAIAEPNDEVQVSENHIGELELILDSELKEKYKTFLQDKNRIVIKGKLYHSQTESDHTKVLIDIIDIKPAQ